MRTNHTCSRHTLAAGDFTLVERCACGTVHLTIGAVTLRLAAPAVLAVVATLDEAARVLVLEDAIATARHGDEALS